MHSANVVGSEEVLRPETGVKAGILGQRHVPFIAQAYCSGSLIL